MGLIKAAINSVGGGLADQWLEVIEPYNLSDDTVMTTGVPVRKDNKRQGNKKGTEGFITDGSVVYVYPNTMMLLVDGVRLSTSQLKKAITLSTTLVHHLCLQET